MKELTLYVFYDVEDDRIRNKIAEVCQDYGLERIQFSGFSGALNKNRKDELFLRIKDMVKDKKAKVLILPICGKDLKEKREIINDALKSA